MKKLITGALLLLSTLGFTQSGLPAPKRSIHEMHYQDPSTISTITGLEKGATGIGMGIYYGHSKTIGVEMTYCYDSVILGLGTSIGLDIKTVGTHIDKPFYWFTPTSTVNQKTLSGYLIVGYQQSLVSTNEEADIRVSFKTGIGCDSTFQNYSSYYNWYSEIGSNSDLLVGGTLGYGGKSYYIDFGWDTYNKFTIGLTYVY